ncbi:hypothetical protein J2861_004981 [Agrobacterium tumefaciens]|nr:hypothetical protein [Agrobacterium tumefaciens]MDP9790966.1 hypothetical protein [Agrobacterium tumefaciens]
MPEMPADIWKYVTPGGEIDVQKGRKDDDNWYVVMEGKLRLGGRARAHAGLAQWHYVSRSAAMTGISPTEVPMLTTA